MTYTPTVKLDWNWDRDYKIAYAETDDPRVLAIIERDDDAGAPYDEGGAPTILGYEYGSRADLTPMGGKSDVPDAWIKARTEYGDENLADRFVRIFHGVTAVHHVSSSIDRYSWAVVFDAPDWRDAMGITPDVELDRDNLACEIIAYLDGDVYGVGYATLPERTTTETDVDGSNLEAQGWDVDIQCWGFYGDDHAKQSAEAFEHGSPTLDTLLDHTNVAA